MILLLKSRVIVRKVRLLKIDFVFQLDLDPASLHEKLVTLKPNKLNQNLLNYLIGQMRRSIEKAVCEFA